MQCTAAYALASPLQRRLTAGNVRLLCDDGGGRHRLFWLAAKEADHIGQKIREGRHVEIKAVMGLAKSQLADDRDASRRWRTRSAWCHLAGGTVPRLRSEWVKMVVALGRLQGVRVDVHCLRIRRIARQRSILRAQPPIGPVRRPDIRLREFGN